MQRCQRAWTLCLSAAPRADPKRKGADAVRSTDERQYLFGTRVSARRILLKSISRRRKWSVSRVVQGGETAIDPGMAARAVTTASPNAARRVLPGARRPVDTARKRILSFVVKGLSNVQSPPKW